MKTRLKALIQNLQINIVPEVYKRRFFKNIEHLDWKSIKDKNIENEILLIRYLLDKNSTFIDIGANLGQYLYTTEKILSKENIYAFEPHPMLNKRLTKIFKGINIHQYAISSMDHKTKFKIPFFNNREIHTRGTLKTEYIDNSETNYKLIDVDVVKLDTITGKLNIRDISLIKIDVEGAEMDVFEGSAETISKHRPILLIEIEQQHHSDSILSFILKIESSCSYKCYYFDTEIQQLKGDIHQQDILQIQSASNHAKNRLFINNFIFLPLEKYDEDKVYQINQNIEKDKNNY